MTFRVGSGVFLASLALLTAGCPPASKESPPRDKPYTAADMPLAFVDSTGTAIDLKAYRGKPVVLVVTRGFPESPGGVFCPYCLAQVGSLTTKYEEFKTRGAEVLIVFPGSGDQASAFAKKARSYADGGREVPYPVCVDKDYSACDRLGIRGDLAKPSTFILDANGDVAFAYVGKGQSDRPTVAAMLAELDRLKK